MTELLTAAQMRAIEQAAIDSGEVTGLELMERAGRGVVEAVLEEWPELAKTSHRAVVLCGPGNNGGDGFVVARLLKERGWEVEVFLYGDAAKLPVDAKANYERWREMGEVGELQIDFVATTDTTLFIDAIFGSGLTRGLTGEAAKVADYLSTLARENQHVCSIDAPSGLCLDSGKLIHRVDGTVNYISADLTVTFHAARIGNYCATGPNICRNVVLAPLGISDSNERQYTALLDEQKDVTRHIPKDSTFHKYSFGHALILSGGIGKGGAARLAAHGALRIGAGLVTLCCPPAALIENAARLDAVMVRSVKGAEGLSGLLEDKRLNTLCLGPGMGQGEHTREMVRVALAAERKVVLDADALTSFQDNPGELFEMLHDDVVLTPHAGEFARLFPDIAEKLEAPAVTGPAYSKVDATREAAERAGCVVLFKGADTVIAGPDGRCSINSAFYDRAAPWLATAGSGDVLAGFITGLLARGFAPMNASETAAWLHVECARAFGPGLIAEDLPEQLPAVFRALGV